MKKEWWRGGVIYQIYPRIFRDANSDGMGDLAGITERLEYVAGLGVDAIWISPFFKSPMKDYGYDVEDYRAVDPIFGDLEDMKHLLARAHELDLKVVIDMVVNHTADTHGWFEESRQSRAGDKADWYVWADAKADGTPPNNWLSVFGGSAWTWEPRRGQYYYHQFLRHQPDLNLWNPAVQDAVLGEVRFWLDLGVDGIRLDACNHFMHHPSLDDNPARGALGSDNGMVAEANPYSMQVHRFDKSQPENIAFLARIRHLLDQYPDRMAVAEIGGDEAPLQRCAEYVSGSDRLHTAYSFSLLGDRLTPQIVRDALSEFFAHAEGGWPSWAFSNHDVERVLSRWGGPDASPQLARMLMALLGCLKGTVFLYQGEELGLPQADIPRERMLDPFGITFYPVFKGRDGCRTPMPWRHDAPHAGFSTVEPFQIIPDAHVLRAVSLQDADPDSVLAFTRRFFGWRRRQPALMLGDITFRSAPDPVLAFERTLEGQRLLCVFNLGGEERHWSLAETDRLGDVPALGGSPRTAIDGRTVILPPHGFALLPLEVEAVVSDEIRDAVLVAAE